MQEAGPMSETTSRIRYVGLDVHKETITIAERWVASARREALDWLLVLNEGHLRCILKEYVEHYNRARPHRSLELRPPTGDPPLGDRDGQVMVMTRLGGLLREYGAPPPDCMTAARALSPGANAASGVETGRSPSLLVRHLEHAAST
jgi:hypothetical protein